MSPVLKFDLRDVDPNENKSYEAAKPGVYQAKCIECKVDFPKGAGGKPDKNKDPMVLIVTEITKPEKRYARLYDRISMGASSKWKLDQMLQALGIATDKKRTGQFNTDKLVGSKYKIRTTMDNPPYEDRARLAAYIAWDPDEDDEDDDDEEEDDELEEDDVEEDEVGEDEEEEDEDEESPDYPHYDEKELNGMQIAGLKSVCSDLELEPPATKKKSVLVQFILDNQPNQEGDEEEEEAEESEESEDSDGYDEMSAEELRAECTDRELKVSSKTSMAAMIKKLREDDEEEPF